ncbi:MAG: hypothetical protein NZ961_03790 [Candidatus Poribacteria bacterium]|nr:hypothetical protein [Candidatus Poribacteria bacterium]
MGVKILSVEQWNSHPAVEVYFLGNQKGTRIYQLEVVWYHGDLGTLVFRLKLGLIVSADTIEVQVGCI